MKPLLSESQDNQSLQALGRASVQIVHDLKNQLNGLKLYATFLRKRLEKSNRPEDELETVRKLITGLDRTATDLSMIVQYGEPLELRKQPEVDLQKIMHGVATSLNDGPRVSGALVGSIVVVNSQANSLLGEFDAELLADALKSISLGAMKLAKQPGEGSLEVSLKDEAVETRRDGVVEWRVFNSLDHDPFHSFAGSDEIRMSLAAKIVEAHGGSAERENGSLRVRLPLTP
jgi:signal transduction histidine kinase